MGRDSRKSVAGGLREVQDVSSFYRKFRAAVKREKLIEPGDSLLAAVSGGLDSMVLLALLRRLRKDLSFALQVAHVNYKKRGADSDAQEELVKRVCGENGLECHMISPPPPATQPAGRQPSPPSTTLRTGSRGEGGSRANFQQWARDFRYRYFAETALRIGAGKVAVGHHRQDQAETVLAHLLRGAGPRGLKGMLTRRPLEGVLLIRPLLGFSREALEDFARRERVPFLHDASNGEKRFWRNRIRMELLPLIESLRPRAVEKVLNFAREMERVESLLGRLSREWLESFARPLPEGLWLPRVRLAGLEPALRHAVLRDALGEIKRDHVLRCDQILFSPRAQGFYPLPGGREFRRLGDDLIVRKSICQDRKGMLGLS